MKKRIIIDEDTQVDISGEENLFYQRENNLISLHDDLKSGDSEVGLFKIWYDAEMEDREYIIINHTIVYLDTIDEL